MIAPSAATSKMPIPPLTSGQRRLMRAACRAAGELASLFFFGGCTVTRQQYPGSFGAGGTAQCSHRLAAAGAAGARCCRCAVLPLRGAAATTARAGGSFGRSAPDGGRFPLRLQLSLLRRRRLRSPAVIQSPNVGSRRRPQPPSAVRSGPPPFARTVGPPCGREFRRIRTRWREISAGIAVFPPSSWACQGRG